MLSFETRHAIESYKTSVFRFRDWDSWTESREYAILIIGNTLVQLATGVLLLLLWQSRHIFPSEMQGVIQTVLFSLMIVGLLIVGVVMFLSTLAGCMRRLNSLGLSPWWIALFLFVPTAGFFVVGLMFPSVFSPKWGCRKGDDW